MIKVVWHYATIASIEIFHNKREVGQHKFRLIRHNEKSCFKTTLCENETIKYYLIKVQVKRLCQGLAVVAPYNQHLDSQHSFGALQGQDAKLASFFIFNVLHCDLSSIQAKSV